MYRNITQNMLNDFVKHNPELEPYIADLDMEKAISASNGISQFPERHAAYHIASYAQFLVQAKTKLKAAISRAKANGLDVGDDIDNEINNEIECFKPKLISAYNEYFHSLARCMSTHVTGPANFPVARQRKRHDAADNKYKAIEELVEVATKRMIRAFLPHGDGSVIRSDSENALQMLIDKRDKLKAAHEKMKAANSVIRRTLKNPEQDKDACINALITQCGFSPELAAKTVEPDYLGKAGFARYELSNSTQNIRSVEKRIREQELLEERRKEGSSIERTFDNGITTELSDDNKILIRFLGKPPQEVRDILSRRAFKWSRYREAWVRKHTLNAESDFDCFIVPVLEKME
ncbi:hypothetical protein ACCF68_004000 [Vibrio parahaemolyticus]